MGLFGSIFDFDGDGNTSPAEEFIGLNAMGFFDEELPKKADRYEIEDDEEYDEYDEERDLFDSEDEDCDDF